MASLPNKQFINLHNLFPFFKHSSLIFLISLCDTPTYSIIAELGSVAINLRTDVNTAKSRGFTANYRMFSPLGEYRNING